MRDITYVIRNPCFKCSFVKIDTDALQPPPPTPSWLDYSLSILAQQYPADHFESMMLYTGHDRGTGLFVRWVDCVPPLYASIVFIHVPRIRCHHCPGRLYIPGPGMTLENFKLHLRNRQHRERVDASIASK